MDRVLEDFISTLRGSGVRISVSETLDAARTVRLVGYDERRLLKDSLAAALAKSAPEKEIFSYCFDRFFSFHFFAERPEDAPRREAADGLSSLSRMLLEGDQAGLITTMREAARAENLSAIQFYTQKSLYVMRILDRMGLSGLDRDIRDLLLSGSPSSTASAASLEEARDYLAVVDDDAIAEGVRWVRKGVPADLDPAGIRKTQDVVCDLPVCEQEDEKRDEQHGRHDHAAKDAEHNTE